MKDTMEMTYNIDTARTIVETLSLTTTPSMIGSWGFNSPAYTTINGMTALTFKVQGFDFNGRIWVAYNEGKDLYQVFGMKRLSPSHSLLHDDVYFDMLGDVLDRIIERGENGFKFYNKTA